MGTRISRVRPPFCPSPDPECDARRDRHSGKARPRVPPPHRAFRDPNRTGSGGATKPLVAPQWIAHPALGSCHLPVSLYVHAHVYPQHVPPASPRVLRRNENRHLCAFCAFSWPRTNIRVPPAPHSSPRAGNSHARSPIQRGPYPSLPRPPRRKCTGALLGESMGSPREMHTAARTRRPSPRILVRVLLHTGRVRPSNCSATRAK
ncbi:hypothetical protein C2E23DRAFT_52233 [Lenzites betulinus]|nr:hypothetical protein C2E23DRAFT_52233 [Lenzites betulinus]